MQNHISMAQILESAIEYKDWSSEIGFTHLQSHYAIKLYSNNPNDCYIVPLIDSDKNKLGVITRSPGVLRTSGAIASLVDDNTKYIFRESEKKTEANEKYESLVESAYLETQCPELGVVLNWVRTVDAKKIRLEMNELEAREVETIENLKNELSLPPNDTRHIVFYVDDQRVTDIPLVANYWRKTFRGYHELVSGVCNLTGKKMDVIKDVYRTKIKGVPIGIGKQNPGASLYSYNQAAQKTYKRDRGDNSPMGFESMGVLYSFLNYLLRTKQHSYLLDDGAILFWGKDGLAINQDTWSSSDFDLSLSPLELIQGLFCFPTTGLDVDCDESTIANQLLNVLVLKGNDARIAIISSFNVTLVQLASNYIRFRDSQIIGQKSLAPWQVSKACCKEITDKPTPFFHWQFEQALLFGMPLSETYLNRVLHLILFAPVSGTGLTNARVTFLRFYTALQEDNGMTSTDTPIYRYAVALGKTYWTIAKAQLLQQDRKDIAETRVYKNLSQLSQNNSMVSEELIVNGLKIYFNKSTAPGKEGLIGKCSKLFDQYYAEVNTFGNEFKGVKFLPTVQAGFLLGFHSAQMEFRAKAKPDTENISNEEE